MALRYIDIVAKCGIASPCDIVTVCLETDWGAKTKSGAALAEGRIVRINKYVTPYTQAPSCCVDPEEICTEECIYQIEINEDQFLQDPGTSKPYLITSADALSLMPYPCVISRILAAAAHDHVLNTAGANVSLSSLANTYTINLPVIDRSNNALISTANLVLGGGAISFGNDNTLVFTSGTGNVSTVDLCNAVSACSSFTTIAVAASGAKRQQYSNGGQIFINGPSTIAYNNIPAGQGASGFLAIEVGITGSDAWSIKRVGEHVSLSAKASFVTVNYSGAGQIATLVTGSAATKTAGYVETTFTNPSPYRPMDILIFATTTLAIAATPASGQIIWGHNLWVDGVRVPDVDGRTLDGFTLSRSIHAGGIESYPLPTIISRLTIGAGATITVGMDFGNNLTYPSVGTTTFISLSSRQIAVIGSTI